MRTISGSSIPQPDCASRSLSIGGGGGAKARISKLSFGFVFVCFRGSKLHSIRATVVKIALRRVFNQFFCFGSYPKDFVVAKAILSWFSGVNYIFFCSIPSTQMIVPCGTRSGCATSRTSPTRASACCRPNVSPTERSTTCPA